MHYDAYESESYCMMSGHLDTHLAGVCVQGLPLLLDLLNFCLLIFLLGYLYFSCWCEEDIYRLFRMNFLLQIGFMFASGSLP